MSPSDVNCFNLLYVNKYNYIAIKGPTTRDKGIEKERKAEGERDMREEKGEREGKGRLKKRG